MGAVELSRATLSRLRPPVRAPRFDPSAVRPGIVHLGLGRRDEVFEWLGKAYEERAGFMDPPENGPAAKMLAPTMKPMAIGAIMPNEPFLGSAAVAYTV